MLPHNLWKVKVQITAGCAPDGRLVELLWCPSASQSLASGASSLSIRGWRSTAAITKLSPSVGWVVEEIKLNYSLANPSIYSCCHIKLCIVSVKMSLSELLWYNQFERFQPPHPHPAGGGVRPNLTNPPPGSATANRTGRHTDKREWTYYYAVSRFIAGGDKYLPHIEDLYSPDQIQPVA